MAEPRTARQVIDQAIRENKLGERLLYLFATLLVVSGVFALVWGVVSREGVSALAGTLSSALFWPAMTMAGRMRRENMAIRLMEDPLNRAETATEAAKALRDFFVSLLVRGNNEDERKGGTGGK